MDSLAFPRALWRRRILVSLGAVLAIAAAAKLVAGSGDDRARAEVRVLLDTRQSQLINADPARVETLPWRANLLSQLLGTESARRQLARDAGIPGHQLPVVHSDLAAPTVPASLPRTAAEAADVSSEVYQLTVHSDPLIPLIWLEAEAPDREAAVRLAGAAAEALETSAAPADTPEARKFTAEPVAPIKIRKLGADHGTLLALGVVIVLFGLWCAGIALIPAIARSTRPADAKPVPRPTK